MTCSPVVTCSVLEANEISTHIFLSGNLTKSVTWEDGSEAGGSLLHGGEPYRRVRYKSILLMGL